jgi:hypothetical protein
MQDKPPDAHACEYEAFLNSCVLSGAQRVGRVLCDLRVLAAALWPRYIQPAAQLGVSWGMASGSRVLAAG